MQSLKKGQIRRAFNKACVTYDLSDHVQKNICLKSIELLTLLRKDFGVIADFACGTGNSTLALMEATRYEKLFAVDISDRLLDVAKKKLNQYDVEFIAGDFEEVLFEEKSMDLIFCNMGLQWSLCLEKTIELFGAYLRDEGILVFTIPLDGTFKELKESHRNDFKRARDINFIADKLNLSEVIYHQSIIEQPFSSHYEALKSIKSVGANCVTKPVDINRKIGLRKSIDNIFIDTNSLSLTYQIGIFVLTKTRDHEK